MILDVCCGGRMFYFDKQDSRVLFSDIRELETILCDGRKFEVKPDVVADFTHLPFASSVFDGVIFDPPHLIGDSKGYQKIKYGHLEKDWKETLTQGFSECFRVMKPKGFLIFKWNEYNIKVSDVLKCTNEKPVLGHRSGKQSKTHWILFVK